MKLLKKEPSKLKKVAKWFKGIGTKKLESEINQKIERATEGFEKQGHMINKYREKILKEREEKAIESKKNKKVVKESIENIFEYNKDINDIIEITDNEFLEELQKEIIIKEASKIENIYVVGSCQNGIETYDIVGKYKDGVYKTIEEIEKNMFKSVQNLEIPTGMKINDFEEIDEFYNLEEFKTKNVQRYAIYRDNEEKLKFAKLIGKRAKNMSTYNIINGNMEQTKQKSLQKYLKSPKGKIKQSDIKYEELEEKIIEETQRQYMDDGDIEY